MGDTWSSLCQACDATIQNITTISVTWIKPPALKVKLNSDGSCLNGHCGGGGIIRDQQGNFIVAYSISLGNGTSNTAEAEAMLFGLKWCAGNGLDMALLLTKCIKEGMEASMEDIQPDKGDPEDD